MGKTYSQKIVMNTKLKAPTVITAHMNADFDALAAMVAAGKIYKDAVLIFPGTHEKGLREFFIQSATYLFNLKSFRDIDPDSVKLLVVVDTRQKSRVAHIKPLLEKEGLEIHMYDHHPDTDEDIEADFVRVEPWGSTTGILCEILQERGVELNPEEATILGLGIYEDTGSFTFNSTTSHDFLAAAWLKTQGMDTNVISDLITRELSAEQISVLSELVASATTHMINGVDVVIAETTSKEYITDYALLVHKFLDMKNLRVLFALGRMADRIHVVARSRTPDVDVGNICAFFGGGGHSYAASATVKDRTLSQVRDELFALLYTHISPKLVVKKLMSSPAVSIDEQRTIADSAELMTRYGLKGVPVVEKGNQKCVGILEHKIADKAVSHGLERQKVGEYMLRKFLSVTPKSDLYAVTEIILGQRQRLVPVVDDDALIGVITRTDLVNILIEEPARMPEALMPDKKKERNIKTQMRTRLPERMFELLQAAGNLAEENGILAYAVGGFVRDILLDRPNFDLDIVVEGDGIDFAEKLVERLGGRSKAHRKFKTAVVVLPDGQKVDVATARLEYYEYPAALPIVELSSIKMDLYRRDFTINALAVNLNPGRFGLLVDFFGAQRDLKEKLIRVLHSLSFVEDPTRILRAVRFEQRFDFQIGAQTLRLIKNAISLKIFNKLSGSRIFHELKLITEEEDPLICLERMQELNLLSTIHPLLKLTPSRNRLVDEVEKVINWYKLLYLESEIEPWIVYFLALFNGLDEQQVLKILQRLNISKRIERDFIELRRSLFDTTMKLTYWHAKKMPLSDLYYILDGLSIEGVLYVMARTKKEDQRKNISHYLTWLRYQTVDITGHDLIGIGIDPGPVFGPLLKKVLAAKIDGKAESRDEQLSLARRLFLGEMV